MALYRHEHARLTGPLQHGSTVQYKHVFSRRDNLTLNALIALNAVAGLSFLGWLLWPSHLPLGGRSSLSHVTAILMVVLMVCLEVIRLGQSATLMFFARRAKDPIPLKPQHGLRVAVLTTIVPGKEPFELVLATLRKMLEIDYVKLYGGVMDVWLLDEGNDPEIRRACRENGIRHFSRKGRPEYNQASGPFKARTKHGNHNAWRAEFEGHYDIVAQMDPDHVPFASFLERTLGYFADPNIAFVVAPQVYGNLSENWIARGSAFLAYVFHGIIQRGGNGLAAPLLIGTNHLYRVTAFTQIGGYQDSIIEDHLTAMKIFATRNPLTGAYWKGVFTPDILAVGEGPMSFTDFFNQQKRWAYGIWQIIFKHSPRAFGQMQRGQRLSFAMLQMFYPSVAISWMLSVTLTALYMFSGVGSHLPILDWALLWGASVGSSLLLFMWLRRFNLVEHERKDWGLIGMGLMLMCIPIYAAAAVRWLSGRKLAYAVTAKGDLTSPDNFRTFAPHVMWATVTAAMFGASYVGVASSYGIFRFWLVWTALICLCPVAIHYGSRLRRRFGTTQLSATPEPARSPQILESSIGSNGRLLAAGCLHWPTVVIPASQFETPAETSARHTVGRTLVSMTSPSST